MDMNYLNRAESPLTARDWELIDTTVIEVARRSLVGRRFLHVFGPLGAGVQDVDYDTFAGTGSAQVAVFGETETSVVRAQRRVHENIPIIYKDFMLYWRDIETSRQLNAPVLTVSVSLVKDAGSVEVFGSLRMMSGTHDVRSNSTVKIAPIPTIARGV